jgi:ribosome-associated protein
MLVIDKYNAIPNEELIFSFARSSGAGGQNVNKVSSKAYLRWNIRQSNAIAEDVKDRFFMRFSNKITEFGDVVIYSDQHRDQPRNIEECRKKLREMILAVLFPPKSRKKTKPSFSSKVKRLDSKTLHKRVKQTRKKVDW